MLQSDALCAQQVENRSRVCGRHRGGKKHGKHQRQMNVETCGPGEEKDKKSSQRRRKHHAKRGQQYAGSQDRVHVVHLGIHTPSEKNHTERKHADELSIRHLIECNAQPLAAKGHARE